MYLKSPFAFLFTLYYNLTLHGLSPFSYPLSHSPYAPRNLSPTNACAAR